LAAWNPQAFLVACAIILLWALSGPVFGYSDTWQLVINTGTTIVTFIMVFLVQNTQNRDARALHLKLDELLRSVKVARNQLINLESYTDEELERIERDASARILEGLPPVEFGLGRRPHAQRRRVQVRDLVSANPQAVWAPHQLAGSANTASSIEATWASPLFWLPVTARANRRK
jgi:low affinity Fe/Cu permease